MRRFGLTGRGGCDWGRGDGGWGDGGVGKEGGRQEVDW